MSVVQIHQVISIHLSLFYYTHCWHERTITLVYGIFSQDHYLLQRCHKRACANIIFALACSCRVLDGCVSKSPPSLHQRTPRTHRLHPWPTHSRPCRFQHGVWLARVLAVSTAAADSFVCAGLQVRCRPSPDAPAYKNCGRFTREWFQFHHKMSSTPWRIISSLTYQVISI